MGRPPNPHGRRSAELGKKYFTVPIPPVDPRVHAAVESHIASAHPWLVQRAQLDKAESNLLGARAKQESLQAQINQLTNTKICALQEISSLKQDELQSSLTTIQESLSIQLEQRLKREESTFQQECASLRNTVPEEEEPPKKRLKLTSIEEEKVQESLQQQQQQQQVAATSEEGEVREAATTNETQAPTIDEQPKPSVLKKKQLEEAESELEGLTETKHQMIWLLKQVIKAEQKQKIQAKSNAEGKSSA